MVSNMGGTIKNSRNKGVYQSPPFDLAIGGASTAITNSAGLGK